MKVLILEPHPDDALISTRAIILDASKQSIFEILTLCEWRENSSSEFAGDLDTLFSECKLPNNAFRLKLPNRSVKKLDDYADAIKTNLDMELKISKMMRLISAKISSFGPDMILSPLGLGHPDHVAVSWAVQALDTPVPILYYVEFPYAFNRYGKILIHDALSRGGKILTYECPWDKSLMSKYYPKEWAVALTLNGVWGVTGTQVNYVLSGLGRFANEFSNIC